MASLPSLPGGDAPQDYRAVLIVDDSAVARSMIARMVDASDRYAVSRSVSSVDEAFAFLANARVDVILLDLQMPGVDGMSALPGLIAAGRGAKILVISSTAGEGGSATVQALALGAADTLEKPGKRTTAARFAQLLADRLDRLFDMGPRLAEPAMPVPHPTGAAAPTTSSPSVWRAAPATAAPRSSRPGGDAYDIVAIGASTGGIHALSQLLGELPTTFRLPILVTQHLPATFMPHFAAQLAVLGNRPCDVAVDRMRIRPGRIIVAPGTHHMQVVALTDGAAIRLIDGSVASGCLPSVDPMFDSVADVYGARALGVVLSGMGRDGAVGAAKLHKAGAAVVVQDVASSVVWGMPGAAVAAGGVDATMTPDAIGRLIAERTRP